MVILNKIYTKTGDAGTTALGDSTRISKDSIRVSAYGTVDELNSVLGIVRLHATSDISPMIARIQNDLFDLGADLCRPQSETEAEEEYPPLRMTKEQTSHLEREIDVATTKLQPLRSFILPGGSPLSSHLHLARTVARRAERLVVSLSDIETINPYVITYLNRLSDWCFVMARMANNQGADDILWIPGENR